eukprot:11662853-Alexandrium_andersonii.AAC.1
MQCGTASSPTDPGMRPPSLLGTWWPASLQHLTLHSFAKGPSARLAMPGSQHPPCCPDVW